MLPSSLLFATTWNPLSRGIYSMKIKLTVEKGRHVTVMSTKKKKKKKDEHWKCRVVDTGQGCVKEERYYHGLFNACDSLSSASPGLGTLLADNSWFKNVTEGLGGWGDKTQGNGAGSWRWDDGYNLG